MPDGAGAQTDSLNPQGIIDFGMPAWVCTDPGDCISAAVINADVFRPHSGLPCVPAHCRYLLFTSTRGGHIMAIFSSGLPDLCVSQ